jgi:hypothetical protein
MGFKLKSGNTTSFKTMGGSEKSPAKQKYDLSKATVDGKHPQTEKNKKYEGMDKGDLFMHGKTRDKDGNVKDIQWAPNPISPEQQQKDKEDFSRKYKDAVKKSPAKQTDTTWADGSKKSKRQIEEQKIHPSEYWYKINGKKATKAEYIKYQNKPGGDEPGKQTNDPTVSLAKKSADKRIKINK